MYRIFNGSLSVIINNIEYYYTTNPGIASQAFVPSLTRGSIVQTFNLSTSGQVLWYNTAFDLGQAQFCTATDGTVYAVFKTAAMPQGCIITELRPFQISSCALLSDNVRTVVMTQQPTTVYRAQQTTVVLGNRVPAPTLCSNQGLQYEVVLNNQPWFGYTAYTAYDPTYLKNRSAGGTWTSIYYTSITPSISGFQNTVCPYDYSGNTTIYGNTTSFPCQQFSVNHRGYFYVYQTGLWTINITNVDDAAILWTGNIAQANWTKPNADISLWSDQNSGSGKGSGSRQYSWTQGQYVPIRIVYANANNDATYFVRIIDPDGNTAVDTLSGASSYVVQYSCDGTSAPPYAYQFGYEL